ncbi:formate/nitrite transporter family protein [Carboxydothermus hydrogenoformans]|uniref:Formate/nitrite transporter family protein n=1 Tax=Carboxydothermus hydrogenoformans (strain ATCC BAA-161 / DSM 6008 / Z-2901) TaxID=246194 RepID=Q3AF47_CARHZ|nr:formate/nitrite transporter family protein [Carboxydothermus hydrogenoformans]ABB14461.1 formate/nitrite transporter family protein [Carboxydothermus hydrogenoformans Z-2901]
MEKNFLTPQEIVNFTLETGIKKAKLNFLASFILGILAGSYIAFGAFAANLISHSVENFGIAKFLGAAVFPVGLMLVVMAGGELFTGNTLMTIALAERKITLKAMLNNWLWVYAGNFVGSFLVAYLVGRSGMLELNKGLVAAAALRTAALKANLTFSEAFIRGILCNILVVLAVWLAYGAKDVVGKVVGIWFPIMTFVLSGYEHSIANMYYFAVGLQAKALGVAKLAHLKSEFLTNLNWGHIWLYNLIPVTLGNIFGGSILIGLGYWLVYLYLPRVNELSLAGLLKKFIFGVEKPKLQENN